MSSWPSGTRSSLPVAAGGERVGEPHRARQAERRDHLLHAPEHEVDDDALEPQELADAGEDHPADLRLAEHFRHGAREVLDDDDDLGAGVDELVLELARGVERVDVDDGAAGAQRAEEAHRILQDVGHHQRHARALRAAVLLQVGAERGGQRVELAERDRLAHAAEGGTIRELADALREHFAYRRVLVDVDFGGNALGIVLEPDLVHESPPPRRMRRQIPASHTAAHCAVFRRHATPEGTARRLAVSLFAERTEADRRGTERSPFRISRPHRRDRRRRRCLRRARPWLPRRRAR